MSSFPNVVSARFRFGRDPDVAIAQSALIHADQLMLRRWFRHHDRKGYLTRSELALLVEDLAAHPELWRHLVRRSPDERHYVRMLLDANVEICLICWCPTQETGFHDHGGSRGAVAVCRAVSGDAAQHRRGASPRAVPERRLLLVRRVAHPRRPARRRRSGRVAARVLAAAGRDGLLRARRRRHPDTAVGRQRRRVLLMVRLRRPAGLRLGRRRVAARPRHGDQRDHEVEVLTYLRRPKTA